ncbi:GntR family transcriptional regulator [Acetobacterium wieringae]|uniref:HTH-type transcriptional repressor YtrA n=1 Tax=Acetobacterium wieringae TaxID=52694 RepID=A0A1F2PMA2_9FIRM|nr:GntR family transcriptional regulator [Acetobacterium wieringae]OFV71984.1 HTH-type transcriptional repressor YtrA [Acetobacterium wieringae]
MNIIIKNSAEVPIYEQIMNQIKAAILSGELKEGDLLPSVRGLARDLNVSVITTRKAYDCLEAEGFTINMMGKGSFVAPQNMELLRKTRLMEIEKRLTDILDYGKPVGISGADLKNIIDVLIREE